MFYLKQFQIVSKQKISTAIKWGIYAASVHQKFFYRSVWDSRGTDPQLLANSNGQQWLQYTPFLHCIVSATRELLITHTMGSISTETNILVQWWDHTQLNAEVYTHY